MELLLGIYISLRNKLMKKIILFIFCLSLFLIFPQKILAEVIINEFSSGTTSDWIELYNNSTESANLSSYKLMDSGTNDKILSGILPAGGFISFSFSNWLNNETPDGVRLFKDDNPDPIDSIYYGGSGQVCFAGETESIGRVDNGNTIERFTTPTKGTSNVGAQLNSCPAPTESPTPMPSPTPTPTSAPTATPVKTASPTPKPTVRPTPVETREAVDTEGTENLILGLRNELTPSSTPKAEEEEKKSFPIAAVLLILGGIACIGGGGVALFKKFKTDYNEKQDAKEENFDNP